MTTLVRIEALKALGDAIVAVAPELTGHVSIGQAPPASKQVYPSLAIVAPRLRFYPAQALEHAELANNVVIYNVGAHEGPVQLRLLSATLQERWTIEAKVLDLFLATPMRPGIAVVPVTSNPDVGQWLAAFELDSDDWGDAAAFDHEYESLLSVNAVIPALVARSPVYKIETLRLQLADIATVDNSARYAPPGVEVVVVNEDGTLSPSSP